ncbi:MAG: acyltransferase [Novosphingobium sp.]
MSVNELPAPSATKAAQRTAGRLEGLDGLRGIAALCVLWFHATGVLHPDWGIAGKGYLAVDFFFMLSGYVMARTYEHRFAEGYTARRFMVARYRKLWPFMALGALLGAPVVWLMLEDHVQALKIVAANVLLIPTIGYNSLYPVNNAAWSILVELSANLIHGLILWCLPTRVLATLLLVLTPLLCWIAAAYGSLAVGLETTTIGAGLAKGLMSYGVGIILWRWWQDRPTIRINPALAFAAMPLLILLVPGLHEQAWGYDVGFVLLACPLMLAGGLACRRVNGVIRWLGLISFPLYAVNLPIMVWANGLGFGAPIAVAGALALASYLALRSSGPHVKMPTFAAASIKA